MRRYALLLALVTAASPAMGMDPWKLKADVDACERSSADPDKVLFCKMRLAIGRDDSPLELGQRLNQMKEFERDKELDRLNCEHGLNSCKPEIARKIRAEQKEHERQRAFEERCKPTEFTDPLGVVRLRYAKPDCGGKLLN